MEPATGMTGWEGLLKAATVALTVERPRSLGTGFFVTPDLVATCAHVVADRVENLPERVAGRMMASGRDLTLRPSPERYWKDPSTGLDLALLEVVEEDLPRPVPVLLSEAVEVGDPLWAFGHPDNAFRAGQPAAFVYEGASSRASPALLALPRLRGTPVAEGFSGGPVVNRRTGAVCGLLSTSDHKGGAHLVSVADLRARCAQVLDRPASTEWLQALTDEQLMAAKIGFAGPRLRGYLDAVAQAAQRHPYPGVLPGTTPPPDLSRVYVEQDVEALPGTFGGEPTRLPGDQLFDGRANVLVVGGPGSGKSSLLRQASLTLSRHWTGMVPVPVKATDLVAHRPLPEALAAGVTAALSQFNADTWSADFFRKPPAAHASWLVLVDGLDEIVDPAHRWEVITKLSTLARKSGLDARYRFVVTSRPLAELEVRANIRTENELQQRLAGAENSLASHFDRYSLVEFRVDQIETFASGWFTALGLPDPAASAEALSRAIGRAGLGVLARTPLMATILCQLFLADLGGELPGGRSQVYEAYVNLLHDHTFSGDDGGLHAQARARLGRFGPDAVAMADDLLRDLSDVIGALAVKQVTGHFLPGDKKEKAALVARRPAQVSETIWQSFVGEVLKRTGLMSEHDDGTFIHLTIAEFLAARYLVKRLKFRRSTIYLFGFSGHRTPYWDDSFLRFLIAELHSRHGLTGQLMRLAKRRGLDGCLLIVGLYEDGTPLPERVLEAASLHLSRMAVKRPVCFFLGPSSPLEALLRLGEGTALLAELAGASRIPVEVRLHAAELMAHLDSARGVRALKAIAADPAVAEDRLRRVPEILADIDEQECLALLTAMASDARAGRDLRMWAAGLLSELAGDRSAEVLLRLSTDPTFSGFDRIRLIELCAESRPEAAARILADLASDRSLSPTAQRMAALHLGKYHS